MKKKSISLKLENKKLYTLLIVIRQLLPIIFPKKLNLVLRTVEQKIPFFCDKTDRDI